MIIRFSPFSLFTGSITKIIKHIDHATNLGKFILHSSLYDGHIVIVSRDKHGDRKFERLNYIYMSDVTEFNVTLHGLDGILV